MSSANRRFVAGAVAFAVCLISVRTGRADEDLYHKVAPSTALIYKNPGSPFGGVGTGFLVDAKERLVITARHVVENLTGGIPPAVTVIFAQSEDGEIITDVDHYRKNWQALAVRGRVIYESVRRDMAVVQLEKLPAGIKPLKLAARKARPGQMVHSIGNSGESFGGVFGYCKGYVRNVYRYEELGARVVVSQTPLNKGDSGGPMVNNLGEVVGFAAMSTTGAAMPKNSIFHDRQVTALSICVSEIRDALQEMRDQLRGVADHSPESKQAIVFKGEVSSADHRVQMHKDVLYRILVKATGFVPDLRCDNVVNYAVSGSAANRDGDWLYLYMPLETKEYRIQVGHMPGRDIGKGSFAYVLTIDQVAFEREADLKATELKLSEHVRKFEAGKPYDITVIGQGFEPDVQIVEGARTVFTRLNNGTRGNSSTAQKLLEAAGLANQEFHTAFRFVPAKTSAYRLLVMVSPYSPPSRGPLKYRVQIVEQKVLLSISDQLTPRDPIYPQAGPFKTYAVKLEAGKTYQIDLTTTAFDSQLVLQDAAGKMVLNGFDAEGYNSRLLFRPTRTDVYRILASSRQTAARGPYMVTVAESAQPVPPGIPNQPMGASNLK